MRSIAPLVLLLGCQGLSGPHDGDGKDGAGSGTGPGGSTAEAVDPGRVVLHRLNRTEYDNTVRDLLGTASTPARDFPSDDLVSGWDNIAANLSVSPLHVELYELAAQELAAEVVAVPLSELFTYRAEGEGGEVTTTTGASAGDAWNLYSAGALTASFEVPVDGTYTLSARVWADQAGPELAKMSLTHDGFVDLTTDVTAVDSGGAQTIAVDVLLDAGVHTVGVSFLNDYYDPTAGEDRNLRIDWVDATGPTDVEPGPNPMRDRWVTCDPAQIGDSACLGVALGSLATKAWRRPLEPGELDRLTGIGDGILADGGTFDDALQWGIVAVLLDPNFIYRVEIDADPTSLEPHPVSDYELASRLSYFLWSSMPDDALFAAAAAGELRTDDQIVAQVERMLADPKASALVDNFGGQWLFIRGIDSAFKDPLLFPGFDDALRASMKEEMTRFFETFVFSDRDMRELLTATEGELDGVLAAHYGIPLAGAGDWEAVDLAAYDRGGLLGQGGFLSVEAYPTRTSPVIRGKFVLGQLLCSEPPPPPPDIPAFDEDATAQTVREQLEQHRANPVCASCHESMDNIGFGLEGFDAIGRSRTEDRGFPVDSTGVLDGVSFAGARELGALLASDPRFPTCMVEQGFTYGLGRLPSLDDGPALGAIEDQFASGGYTFAALVTAIVTSEPFTARRGEQP
ncbi:MAG: DUF1592 domain-containing protein [Myxococcota bacterium]